MARVKKLETNGPRRDRVVLLWAGAGAALFFLSVLAVASGAVSVVWALNLAAAYCCGLALAMVRRNRSSWLSLLTGIEDKTRRRISGSVHAASVSGPSFFHLLDHECRRSRRYNLDLSVVYVRCVPLKHELSGAGETDPRQEGLSSRLRSADIVGPLGPGEFAFILPYTNRAGAEIVLKRTAGFTGVVEACGLAVIGDAASEPGALLGAARADADSRGVILQATAAA